MTLLCEIINIVLKLNLIKLSTVMFLFLLKYLVINLAWYKKDQVTKANIQSETELLPSS